jgi:hypothetical protein
MSNFTQKTKNFTRNASLEVNEGFGAPASGVWFDEEREVIVLVPFFDVFENLNPETALFEWQNALRLAALANQNMMCPYCGEELVGHIELHHALIAKSNCVGTPSWYKVQTQHSYNVLVLHRWCHEKITTNESARYLADMFGRDAIVEWFESMNKVRRVRMPSLEL